MNIAVIGSSEHGAAEAQFLMSYGSRVTLLAQNSLDLSRSDIAELAHRGIEVARSPIQQLNVASDQVEVSLEDGQQLRFDTLYPALGSSPRTRLATAIGARLSSSGCLLTDLHQQTSVPGLFAAGDVVEGLDQISVAIGQAAKAATAIHNLLRDRDDEVALAKETSGISHPRSI